MNEISIYPSIPIIRKDIIIWKGYTTVILFTQNINQRENHIILLSLLIYIQKKRREDKGRGEQRTFYMNCKDNCCG